MNSDNPFRIIGRDCFLMICKYFDEIECFEFIKAVGFYKNSPFKKLPVIWRVFFGEEPQTNDEWCVAGIIGLKLPFSKYEFGALAAFYKNDLKMFLYYVSRKANLKRTFIAACFFNDLQYVKLCVEHNFHNFRTGILKAINNDCCEVFEFLYRNEKNKKKFLSIYSRIVFAIDSPRITKFLVSLDNINIKFIYAPYANDKNLNAFLAQLDMEVLCDSFILSNRFSILTFANQFGLFNENFILRIARCCKPEILILAVDSPIGQYIIEILEKNKMDFLTEIIKKSSNKTK